MALQRADLGTPHLTVCPRCTSGHAFSHPIYILTAEAVDLEPWVLLTCRDCGFIGKAYVEPGLGGERI